MKDGAEMRTKKKYSEEEAVEGKGQATGGKQGQARQEEEKAGRAPERGDKDRKGKGESMPHGSIREQ